MLGWVWLLFQSVSCFKQYSLFGLGWVGGTVRMSTRVVSFAQIESICLLSGLGIALSFATAAKHQNLNQKLTNFMEQDLNLI